MRLELLRPPDALPRIDLDPEKIEQAVLNLVLNALEAMPDGGDLTLGAEVEAGKLRMVVSDTGPGIPPEIQDHIFRPYFSTKGTRDRDGPGPRGEAGPPAPRPARLPDRPRGDDLLDHPARERPERERPAAMSNEPFPILIVDDEPNIRTGLARALECESYAISTAKDADEALRTVPARPATCWSSPT